MVAYRSHPFYTFSCCSRRHHAPSSSSLSPRPVGIAHANPDDTPFTYGTAQSATEKLLRASAVFSTEVVPPAPASAVEKKTQDWHVAVDDAQGGE